MHILAKFTRSKYKIYRVVIVKEKEFSSSVNLHTIDSIQPCMKASLNNRLECKENVVVKLYASKGEPSVVEVCRKATTEKELELLKKKQKTLNKRKR